MSSPFLSRLVASMNPCMHELVLIIVICGFWFLVLCLYLFMERFVCIRMLAFMCVFGGFWVIDLCLEWDSWVFCGVCVYIYVYV